MRAVNLLPVQVAERGALLKALPLVGAAAVPMLAISLLVIGYSGAQSVVSAKSAQLAVVRAQVAKLAPVVVGPAPSTAGLVAERTQRRAALDTVLAIEVPWDETLREIARVLPANVWLSTMNATSPTPADVAAPVAGTASSTGFAISGFALDESDVALLLARLQLLPSLTNLTLTQTTSSSIGSKTIVQFDITAGIQPVQAPVTLAPVVPAPVTPAVKP
jgi:type IV pilus assembly PilN-like protein